MTEFKLKSLHDKAVEINEVLIKEHKYEKLVPHLDNAKVSLNPGYIPIEDCGKYAVAANVNKRWAIYRTTINQSTKFELFDWSLYIHV